MQAMKKVRNWVEEKAELINKGRMIYSYLLFVSFTLYSIWLQLIHEPWRDEALAWVLGRDHSFLGLLAQLRYEGHPFLWMWICGVFAKLGLPYQSQTVFHLLFVLGIVFIICFKSPFSSLFKTLILIGTPLLFSVNAVARTYAPSIFFILLVAWIYQDRYRKYILYAFSLFCMMQLNVYSFIVASGLFGGDVAALLIKVLKEKSMARFREVFLNRRFLTVFCVYGMSAVFFILVNMSDVFRPFLEIKPVTEYTTYYDVHVADVEFTLKPLKEETHAVNQFLLFHMEELSGKLTHESSLPTKLLALIMMFYTFLPVLIAGKRSGERWFLALAGAFQIMLLLTFMVLTPVGMAERHASVVIFGMIALYGIACEERKKSWQKEGHGIQGILSRVIITGGAALLAVCMIFSMQFEVERVIADRDYLYSSSREAAKAIISQGYDRKDVLIVASGVTMTNAIIPYLKEQRYFLYDLGFRSFPHQQEIPADMRLNLDYVAIAEAELKKNPGRYQEVLVILLKEEEETIAKYDKLYEKIYDEAGKYFRQEGYVIYRIGM